MPDQRDWTRRQILQTAAAGSLARALAAQPAARSGQDARPIPSESVAKTTMPGTRDWMATNVSIDPKTKYRCPWIEGYASKTSVRAGESISLHVSTNPPSPFRRSRSIAWAITRATAAGWS